MDGSRFDALARRVSCLTTRRGMVRLLAGGVAGLGLGSGRDLAQARKRDCRLVGEPCGKSAGGPGRCCPGALCTEDQVGGGVCTCPPNLQECHGFCVDIAANPLACGIDCVVCADDADCCNGICCKAGGRCCGGSCTDLTTDNGNRGGCGQECPDGLTCCESRCRAFADDPRHRGSCRNRCGENETCADGRCVCRKSYGDCGDGVCRSLLTDSRNRGRCGRVCGSGQRCVRGRCKCAPGSPTTCLPSDNRCGVAEDRPCTRDAECCLYACVAYGGSPAAAHASARRASMTSTAAVVSRAANHPVRPSLRSFAADAGAGANRARSTSSVAPPSAHRTRGFHLSLQPRRALPERLRLPGLLCQQELRGSLRQRPLPRLSGSAA